MEIIIYLELVNCNTVFNAVALAVPDHYDEIPNTLTNSSKNSAKPNRGGEKSSIEKGNYRKKTHGKNRLL
ncbi:MAG: hypothetical protein ACI80L_000148 [Pseudohongiellaceae bacterium]